MWSILVLGTFVGVSFLQKVVHNLEYINSRIWGVMTICEIKNHVFIELTSLSLMLGKNKKSCSNPIYHSCMKLYKIYKIH
jgi:hypothetical protein